MQILNIIKMHKYIKKKKKNYYIVIWDLELTKFKLYNSGKLSYLVYSFNLQL